MVGLHFAAAHLAEYRNGSAGLPVAAPDNFSTAADQALIQTGLFRDSLKAAMIALMWADLPGVDGTRALDARCFAKAQMAYVLGDNAKMRSYVIGWTRCVLRCVPNCFLERSTHNGTYPRGPKPRDDGSRAL